MLEIAGLLFIYADYYMGGVDLLADLIGYSLLLVAIMRGWISLKVYALQDFVISVCTVIVSCLVMVGDFGYLPLLILGVVMAVGQYVLVRKIYQSRQKKRKDPSKTERDAIVYTSLIVILICELGTPILGIVTILPYIILILELIVGIPVCVSLWRTIQEAK